MVAGVDAVCCEMHGAETETSAAPSMQAFAIVEGTVDEVSKIGRNICRVYH